MKHILLFICLVQFHVVSSQHRQEIHCKHFYKGNYPYGTPLSNDLIIRDLYAMSTNDSTKFADWVAYRLDTASISGKNKPRNWKKDPWLSKDETLEPSDYKGANEALETDRGHQAPLASLDGTDEYFTANYMSNITPQKANLNQGPWKQLEKHVRSLVDKHGEVYVISGPLYERQMPKLPEADEFHVIPSGYWKVVIYKNDGKTVKKGWIMDQSVSKEEDFNNCQASIEEIEKRSKLDLFW
ncbi:DNA/RNA non-specific endonuclease [Aureibacter tunicatorum]|uniref:Endonuclease n=1 Tax=Aureibacter tunicatorum TaxID=866807 RepID=A0AAE3XTI6_9BACT|nr:DNA/RNA non-specific endonuclease [Aureibacter tunicatorum]MDR6241740.1 endonuclease G [Aureibacter tunicatorum]BDD07398.1 hypothetical protein AUTU_48810 [Aureibacter tunicatorum]